MKTASALLHCWLLLVALSISACESFALASGQEGAASSHDVLSGVQRRELASKGKIAFSSGETLTVVNLDGSGAIHIEAKSIGEPNESAGGVEPLAFSPDGSRLAVRVWQAGERVYVLEVPFRRARWVTKGLLTEVDGQTSRYYDHVTVAWSPNGRRLAIVSHLGQSRLLSVFDEAGLRTIHKHQAPEGYDSPFLAAWSKDSSTLFVVPPQGGKPREVLAVNAETGAARVVFKDREPRAFQALAWDPAHTTLALAAGKSLLLYDGRKVAEVAQASSSLRKISWSADGKRLALADWNGGITVVDRDGSNPWQVTHKIAQKWFAPNVAWLDGTQFAFVLVTRTRGAGIYLAEIKTRKVSTVLKDDIVSTDLKVIPGQPGFVYLRVTSRGPWEASRSERGPWRTRRVGADLYLLDHTGSRNYRLTNGSMVPGRELEGDFGVYMYPVFYLR